MKDSQQQAPRGDPDYDPLYKLQPLVDMCHHNFLAHCVPAKEMSIDEAMVKYKGRIFFRQYMPKINDKVGHKGMDDCRVKNRVCEQF